MTLSHPINNIVAQGIFNKETKKIEDATEMYPGRLVQFGTDNTKIKVGDALHPPVGWLGWEHTPKSTGFQPATKDTIYKVNDFASKLDGIGPAIEAKLVLGCNIKAYEQVANWTNGQVIGPAKPMFGGIGIGIPFKFLDGGGLVDTKIDIPGTMAIILAGIEVTTLEAGDTIDAGFKNDVEGGDEDGLIDGASLAVAGLIIPDVVLDGGGAFWDTCLIGAYLRNFIQGTNADDRGLFNRKHYITDGTKTSLTYTITDSALAKGRIWVIINHPGFKIVGEAVEAMDAEAAAKDLLVRSVI